MVAPGPGPTRDRAPEPPTGSPAAQPDTGFAPAASQPEIRRIGRWVSTGIKGARRLVIRDPQTWSRFWSELGAGVQPEVDFRRGHRRGLGGAVDRGSRHIAVQRVTRSGGRLRIEVVETTPGADCITTGSLTQPVDVVMVPAEGVTGWGFIDRTVTGAC